MKVPFHFSFQEQSRSVEGVRFRDIHGRQNMSWGSCCCNL